MPVNIFTTNIPLKGQSLGFTQPLVLGNFANYKENMEVNHEGINSANFGKHKFLTLTNQSSAPTTGATESGIYGTQVAGRMVNFFQRESNLAEVGITIYPGTTLASTFAAATPIIDLSTLVNTAHPNFWGIFEIRTVSGIGLNGLAILKVYEGTSGYVYTVFPLTPGPAPITSFGITYSIVASTLYVSVLPAIASQIARWTITPFYFPET